MTKRDGGLRAIFRQFLPEFDWQAIETGQINAGVPDDNYCLDGVEGWVEHKQTSGWKIGLRPCQIGWIERRMRHGGRIFIAVRRRENEFWFLNGQCARKNSLEGLDIGEVLAYGFGPPSRWPWEKVRDFLRSAPLREGSRRFPG